MNANQNMKSLADDELLSRAKNLANQEREITAKLLNHLMEIERRLLFAKLGYSSLFKYVTEELGFCAASAQMRIASMRLMVAVPEIEEKIVAGTVSLTNLAQAQRFFNHEKKEHRKPMSVAEKKQVIEKLEGLSTRDAEKELMALSSNPDSFVRPDQIRPVTPTMSEVRFTADQNLLDQLEEIRCLLAHQNAGFTMAELIAKMAEFTLKILRSARFATLKNKTTVKQMIEKNVAHSKSMPTPTQGLPLNETQKHNPGAITSRAKTKQRELPENVENTHVQTEQNGNLFDHQSPQPSRLSRSQNLVTPQTAAALKSVPTSRAQTVELSRYIPLPVRRAVFARDRYQCCYRDPTTGRRCASRFALQIHHKISWAKGGPATIENLRTTCATHNAWAAIGEFGQEKMQAHRWRNFA